MSASHVETAYLFAKVRRVAHEKGVYRGGQRFDKEVAAEGEEGREYEGCQQRKGERPRGALMGGGLDWGVGAKDAVEMKYYRKDQ